MTAPTKWEAYRVDRESRYVIHVEVDAGPFVFHRYGILDALTLYEHGAPEVVKMAVEELTHEVTNTLRRIRGTA